MSSSYRFLQHTEWQTSRTMWQFRFLGNKARARGRDIKKLGIGITANNSGNAGVTCSRAILSTLDLAATHFDAGPPASAKWQCTLTLYWITASHEEYRGRVSFSMLVDHFILPTATCPPRNLSSPPRPSLKMPILACADANPDSLTSIWLSSARPQPPAPFVSSLILISTHSTRNVRWSV